MGLPMKKKSKSRKTAKTDKPARKKAVNGRQKGSNQERRVAKLFSEWWGSECYRTPGSGSWATKKTNKNLNASGDIVCEDPNFVFTIECKKQEGWNLEQLFDPNQKGMFFKWWDQCVSETPEGKIPLLVFNRNGVKELCAIRDEDLPQPVEDYFEGQTKAAFYVLYKEENIVVMPLSVILSQDKVSWL